MDFFYDGNGNWWGVVLFICLGFEYIYYFMGWEIIMMVVFWFEGEYLVWIFISGEVSGWFLLFVVLDIKGVG